MQTNWPDRFPADPRRMTVQQAADALEWLAATVPPPVTAPAG